MGAEQATVSTDVMEPASGHSLGVVFAPVRSQTAFEETVERLGSAIRLGLLPPGTRLPAERELCERLGIARSTLRQALVALGRSGHVHALRGRGGGTFVADPQPPALPPTSEQLACWRSLCDERRAVEVGIAQLAAERAEGGGIDELERCVLGMDATLHDFPRYRLFDVRLHIGIAELTQSPRLVALMTHVEASTSSLLAYVVHPPDMLEVSNGQHRRLLEQLQRRDVGGAGREMSEHTRYTEAALAELLPGLSA
ncbi:MAG TPA: FCD domain-containing protein [Solirubrobacteraceae bacterium]|nr:FCD domain-containing protein [Solirubrobacteraceae bacterium]